MNNPAKSLNPDEQKLLEAAVVHMQADPNNPKVTVHRVPYGFETNLETYPAPITEEIEKARWETALKGLISSGLLHQVDCGNQTWNYVVTQQGFKTAAEHGNGSSLAPNS